jgi:hypothetical protein
VVSGVPVGLSGLLQSGDVAFRFGTGQQLSGEPHGCQTAAPQRRLFEDRPYLDCPAISVDNGRMDVPGRVENGVVVLEGGMKLPEGAQVVVSLRRRPDIRVAPTQRPVQLPIFDYNGPPDIDLTNDQIAEILTREDASP